MGELVHVNGLSVYGNPWDRKWSRQVPPNIDILITHDPPQGILDGGHGCEFLRKDIAETTPRIHLFGHIHEACGVLRAADAPSDVASTLFVNAALANDGMVSKRLDKFVTVIDVLP